MAQNQIANFDMEEMDELEVILQLAELTQFCGILDTAAGEVKGLKLAM